MMAEPSMAESMRDWIPALGTFLAKWGAGIAGSIVSLRFLPAGTSRANRLFAFAGGVLCVLYVAPAILDVFSVESARIGALIQFVTGLLGMASAGDFSAAVSQLELAGIAKEWLRRKAGLSPEQPPSDQHKGE